MAFKDDIKLDITNLDKIALKLPSLYDEWATKWVNSVNRRDHLKEKLSVARAEADEEIRESPNKFGWTSEKSPTEAWVSNQITLHKKVRKTNEELLEAQYEVNVFSAAKETLHHVRGSLENLTELFRNGYFSARSRSGEFYNEALNKAQLDQEKQIDEDLKRRKK